MPTLARRHDLRSVVVPHERGLGVRVGLRVGRLRRATPQVRRTLVTCIAQLGDPSRRLLLLDLGNTLVRDGQLFPHVVDALQSLAQMETAGSLLATCLVSDYLMADPIDDSACIAALFDEYVAILEGLGLLPFFEPVEERVTLSTHAGVRKPDRRVFELAIERSGTGVALDECIFVTEHKGHVTAARALGMVALRFDPDSASADFRD